MLQLFCDDAVAPWRCCGRVCSSSEAYVQRNPMRELYEQLRKVIDLPERCREVTTRVAMGEVPTVTATYFPDESKATGEPVTQRFTLTPIDEDNRSGVTAPASTYWQVQ